MKEPSYWMRMIATGGCILADDTCKETVIRRKGNWEDLVKKFKYKLPSDWHFRFWHVVYEHNNLRHILTSIEYTRMTDWWECWLFFSFWPYQRLMHFWFYAAFSSVGCIRSKCLRYWSFVWSWHVNLLTYYTLGNGGGFLTDSTHLLMTAPMYARRYKNWRWICTTETAYQHYSCSFKCWKRWGHILYTPQGCGYAVILMFGIF